MTREHTKFLAQVQRILEKGTQQAQLTREGAESTGASSTSTAARTGVQSGVTEKRDKGDSQEGKERQP